MMYLLKGSVFIQKGQELESLNIYEEFQDENITVARVKAFSKFDSYLDVFRLGVKNDTKHYENSDLQCFVNSGKKSDIKTPNGTIAEFDTDFERGLCLYLVEDENDCFQTLEGLSIYNKKHLLRCFDNQHINLESYIKLGLKHEAELYELLCLNPVS